MTTQNYSYTQYTPRTSDGGSLSIWRSAYKNVRFNLKLQTVRTLTETDASDLPGLSYRLYGTVDYFRILLHYNGLACPIQDVYPGMQFRVPTQASIVAWLTRQQNNTTVTRII